MSLEGWRLSKFEESIHNDYIDYRNNYLTIEKWADDYNFDHEAAKKYIECGRILDEKLYKLIQGKQA